jgi:hypothetical protein
MTSVWATFVLEHFPLDQDVVTYVEPKGSKDCEILTTNCAYYGYCSTGLDTAQFGDQAKHFWRNLLSPFL